MHRANDSLLESADGSMATVATRLGDEVMNKQEQSTWLRPAFSWKAVTLRTPARPFWAQLDFLASHCAPFQLWRKSYQSLRHWNQSASGSVDFGRQP